MSRSKSIGYVFEREERLEEKIPEYGRSGIMKELLEIKVLLFQSSIRALNLSPFFIEGQISFLSLATAASSLTSIKLVGSIKTPTWFLSLPK